MAARCSPSPDGCLVFSRRGRFRGGTIIVAEVVDLAEHERRVHDGDSYRPAACPRCGHARVHVHGRVDRRLLGEALPERTTVLRYICASAACRATWRVLPALLARHLWRRWSTVARTVVRGPTRVGLARVPARTARRWRQRLATSARQIVLLLSEHADDVIARAARAAGFEVSRRALVEVFAATRAAGTDAFAGLAAAVHHVEPGVRLM